MSITFVSSTNDNSNSGTSVTVAEPAGVAENDFYIAVCSINNENTGSWDTPSGWTKLTEEFTATTSTDKVVGVFYRLRGSSAAGNTVFNFTGGTANDIMATIAAYRGVDTTTPFDVTYASGSHYAHAENTTTGGTPAAITTVTDGAAVVLACAPTLTITALGAPTGFSLDAQYSEFDRGCAFASKVKASFGTETPGAWTHTLGASSENNSFTFALKPAVAAVTYSLDLQPLYYGATLMASKTNIEFVIESGHVLGGGTTEASGTAGTTDASGIFQVPGGYSSATADDVTVSLYWEEGDPAENKSIIVKTTLTAV